ncbi:MAG: ATP-binding protein [bacterium]
MINKGNERKIKFTIPCQSKEIGDSVEKIISGVEKIDSDIFDIKFRVEMVAREMLANAIGHGCDGREGIIKIELEVYIDQIKLKVKDPGKGFDYENIDLISNSFLGEGGRGLAMIKKGADRVEFNETGNTITAFFKVSE